MTRPWSYWSSPAARSDPSAWTEIVERYAQLLWSKCTWFQLSNHDYEDVGQNVWLLPVEQPGKLREPAVPPGWLTTTTQRKCLRG
jgi:DNA-directed RNA polymerase specialized sigma24 family protein